MSYCPKCNAEVRANARFCSKCGYKQADPPSLGLIRPIVTMPSRKHAPLPAIPPRPHSNPTDTPASPLILKPPTPVTPPHLSVLNAPVARPAPPRPQQIIRPVFPLAKAQKTNTVQTSEQKTQQAAMIDAHDDFADIDEGFIATSRAAQRWRTSWRNRQRIEAGPATTVSRGQSSVPQPLLAMQDSLMRIRAVIAPQHKQDTHKASPAFWITIFLMICLIAGLGAYIAFSYLPADNNTVRPTTPTAISNQRGELTLPVELQVRDAVTEIAITPNPLVGVLASSGQDGTCQANTLLLINLSDTPVSWNMQMDDTTKQHIQFVNHGKPYTQGTLVPAGQHGDTQILTLVCAHVQNGDRYHFTINVNNIPWSQTVTIQTNSPNP